MRAHNVTPERLREFLSTNERIEDTVFVSTHNFGGVSATKSRSWIIQQIDDHCIPSNRFEVSVHSPNYHVHLRPEAE